MNYKLLKNQNIPRYTQNQTYITSHIIYRAESSFDPEDFWDLPQGGQLLSPTLAAVCGRVGVFLPVLCIAPHGYLVPLGIRKDTGSSGTGVMIVVNHRVVSGN